MPRNLAPTGDELRAAELARRLAACEAALTALCDALDREEAHAHQPAPDHDLGRYCAEGQRLREEVRRRRREAAAALASRVEASA